MRVNPSILLPTPFNHQAPLQNTANQKGITVLLGERRCRLRYPVNGKFIVCPSGKLIDKPLAIVGSMCKRKGTLPDVPDSITKPEDTNIINTSFLVKLINNPETLGKKGYTVNKKRVQECIFHGVNAQKGNCRSPKLYFFTISFPPCVGDDLGYKLLTNWLVRLRKEKHGGMSYLWVAERQQNGTIHFHMPVFHYLNVGLANRYMVSVLKTQIKKGNLNMSIYAAKRYNGVDIAKNRNTGKVVNFAEGSKQKSLAIYLSKYVTKNNAHFPHLAWNCSNDISSLKSRIAFTDSEFDFTGWSKNVDWSRKREIGDKINGFFAVWFPWKEPPKDLIEHLAYLNYLILEKINSPIINN
jgi:hypothetical protein